MHIFFLCIFKCKFISLSPSSPSQPFLISPVPPSPLSSPLALEKRSRQTGSCKLVSVKWIISQKKGVVFTQMVLFSFNKNIVFSDMVSIQPSCNFFSTGDILVIFGYVI